DVATHGDGLLADVGSDRLGAIEVDVGHDHARAALRERARARGADAAARARDHGHRVGEVETHALLPACAAAAGSAGVNLYARAALPRSTFRRTSSSSAPSASPTASSECGHRLVKCGKSVSIITLSTPMRSMFSNPSGS